MGGSEDPDSYQAFIGFNDEELTNHRTMERERFQVQPTPVTMERLLILNVLADLQLTKENLEDGIRLMADPRLMVSQEVSGKVLTRLWIGLRRLILVQKYLHLAAHKSVQLVIKYLSWQATAKESESSDEDALASQRNFVSSLKKLSFVTSPSTEQMFLDLVVPEFDDIVKQMKSGADLLPLIMTKDQQSDLVLDNKDWEELIDIKTEDETSDVGDQFYMKIESSEMTPLVAPQGEFDNDCQLDLNEYLSVDMKQKGIDVNHMDVSNSKMAGVFEEEHPEVPSSGQDDEMKHLKKEESIHEEGDSVNASADEKPHRCTICGKCYPSNSKLQDHLNAHSGVKPHQCDVCSKSFYSKDLRRQHQKIHRLPCEFCQVVFNAMATLNRHKKIVHGSQSSTMVTDKRTKEVANKARKSKYVESGDEDEEEPEDVEDNSDDVDKDQHKCRVCGKCYASKSKLQDHINTHTGAKPYQCDVCNKAFSSRDSLCHHKKIHSNEKFPCELCNRTFNTKGALNKHGQKAHGESKLSTLKESKRIEEDLDESSCDNGLAKKCNGCDKWFNSFSELSIHVKLEHVDCDPFFPQEKDNAETDHISSEGIKDQHECRICGRSFRSNSKLQDHLNTHTGERPHQCDTCQKAFGSKDALRGHQEIHSETQFHCDQCGKMFNTRTILYKHRQKEHYGPEDTQGSCNGQDGEGKGRSTPSEGGIDHKAKPSKDNSDEANKENYKCRICGRGFRSNSKLQDHINTHTGERPHQCKVCNKAFGSKDALRGHQEIHSATQFNCEQCGKMFNTRTLLYKHRQKEHSGRPYASQDSNNGEDGDKDALFECDICNAEFDNRSEFRDHQVKEHNLHQETESDVKDLSHDEGKGKMKTKKASSQEEPNMYSCHVCNKEFKTKKVFKQHINRNLGKKPLKCDVCNCMFHTEQRLMAHLDNHTEKFMCDFCGKTYNLRKNLRLHVLSAHGGDKGQKKQGQKKPIRKKEMCSYCGIVMGKSHLRYHIYRHTGEKPFKCTECPKAFTTPNDLFLHKDIHSSKTFLCPFCGKVFNTYASVKTHKRKFHRHLMAVKAKEEEIEETQD